MNLAVGKSWEKVWAGMSHLSLLEVDKGRWAWWDATFERGDEHLVDYPSDDLVDLH